MTEREKRKGGGAKLSRSETVTVRLDPRLRYLGEVAGRVQRRTLSSYIEWALKQAIDGEALRPNGTPPPTATGYTVGAEGDYLWDVDECDRLVNLADRYPHLLTYEEQRVWKVIRESVFLWSGNGGANSPLFLLDREKLRRNWQLITSAAADGKTGADVDFDMI